MSFSNDKKRNLFVEHRRDHSHAGLDNFPTPGWATRALLEYVIPDAYGTVLEPAAGAGHMVRVLEQYGWDVTAQDIIGGKDFLGQMPRSSFDWVITNPPFFIAEEFIHQAFRFARSGVAMLTRINFLESIGRFERLFKDFPPAQVAVFSERIGFQYGTTAPDIPTAVAHAWLVWRFPWRKEYGQNKSRIMWIPSCRKRLVLDEDWG
jgi:hypothetical protein